MAAAAAEPTQSGGGKRFLGIDFGSNSSRLALLDPRRKMPVIVRNTLSNESTPTVIALVEGEQRCYGEDAISKLMSKPSSTVAGMKQVAADVPSPDKHALGAPTVRDAATGEVECSIDGQPMSLTQATSFYLSNLLSFVGQPAATHVVLAVPSFTPSSEHVNVNALRKMLRDAALVAGAPNVDIITEAEALALYAHHLLLATLPGGDDAVATPVAIVSVGHCFSSVAIVELSQSQVIIRDARAIAVGSSAFDDAVADRVVKFVAAQKRVDLTTHKKSLLKVAREATKAKTMLSSVDKCSIQLESLKDDTDITMPLTRAELEADGSLFVQALEAMLAASLAATGISVAEGGIRVEAVGNGFRTPLVQQVIKRVFNVATVGMSLDSNMSVAEGCAIWGAVTYRDIPATPAAATGGAEDAAPAAPPSPTLPDADAWSSAHVVQHGWAATYAALPPVPSPDAAVIQQLIEKEALLGAADEKIRSRIKVKNALESAVLNVDELGRACGFSAAESAVLDEFVQQSMNWLDDDCEGAEKEAIAERHASFLEDVRVKFPRVEEQRQKLLEEERRKEAELEKQAKERQADRELKSDPQRMRVAQERREQGVQLFKQEHWEEAQTRFVQALGILGQLYDTTSEENRRKKDEIALSCHLNIASCSLKLGIFRNALNNCTKALEIDPRNAKALYRRGQSHVALSDFELAKADLEKALELSSGDAAVQQELARLNERIAAQKAKEKKMFSKMFA